MKLTIVPCVPLQKLKIANSMSSPSRSPSPLPPTRYFDLLPTELIYNIFRDLDEVPRTRTAEVTLLSLCLTSKLCRSLAQPLLLKCIKIHFKNPRAIGQGPLTGAEIDAAQHLLKRLVENNSDQALAAVETLLFNKEKHKNTVKWLKKLVEKAINLWDVCLYDEIPALKTFFGSSTFLVFYSFHAANKSTPSDITKLSIHCMTIKLKDVFAFPELVHLSFSVSPIHQDGGLRINLPKVRHLGFFFASFGPQELQFLHQLTNQLVSLTVHLSDSHKLPSTILNSPSISILFEYYPTKTSAVTLEGVNNLLIPLTGDHQSLNHQQELSGLRSWTNFIANSSHRLETLTLFKWRKAGGGGGIVVHPDTQSLLPALEMACRDRDVEVIWDERSGYHAFDDRVPPTFVRKSEARYAKLKEMEAGE
jgi:hypothetical protein